jgi:chromate reductase
MKPQVLAISGSTRVQSSNNAILRLIAERFADVADVRLYQQIDQLPHFNPDLDQLPFPEKVVEFRQLVEQADAILICTPEYVFSLPGSLKNALEWIVSTTILSYKPAAFIVASASGKMAFESLDLILETLLQEPIPEKRKLLVQGSRGKIDANGKFTDAETVRGIDRLVEALLNC